MVCTHSQNGIATRKTNARLQQRQLNPTRIAGMVGGIAINAVLLMLLIRPLQLPMGFAPQHDIIVVPPIIDIKPPAPPPIVPVAPPTHEKVPQIIRVPTQAPPTQQIVIEQGTLPVDPVERPMQNTAQPTTQTSIDPTDPGPITGMSLQYAAAPAPDYPVKALAEGIEGTVLLQVLVDIDGKPLQVDIQRSSGNRHLDRAARDQVLRAWRFQPAMRNGIAVQAIGLVPIDFKLN